MTPPTGFITRYDIAPTPGIPQSGRECVRTIGQIFVNGVPDWTIFERHANLAKLAGVPYIVGLTNSNPWDSKAADSVGKDCTQGKWVHWSRDYAVFVPDENDPKYQNWWDDKIRLFGAHFNGKAIAQYRSGCGGEGTIGGYHSPSVAPISSDAAIFIIQTYRKYFPDSPAVIMTDNLDGLAYAVRNIPNFIGMKCSLGNKTFDAQMSEAGDLLKGVPLWGEPYGGTGVDQAKVLAQIKAYNIKAVSDWNWGWPDGYTDQQKTAYVKSVGQALALVSNS